MLVRLQVTAGPAVEPVAVNEAKAQLRIDHDNDDALIGGLISVAREWTENYLNRALITQTLSYTFSPSPLPQPMPLIPTPILIIMPLNYPQVLQRPIELPRNPVQSVLGVTNTRRDGTVTVLAAAIDYYADVANEPARVTLRTIGQSIGDDLTISFVAGYGASGAAVPFGVKHAILLIVSYLYENRGDDAVGDMPSAAKMLLGPHRLMFFA